MTSCQIFYCTNEKWKCEKNILFCNYRWGLPLSTHRPVTTKNTGNSFVLWKCNMAIMTPWGHGSFGRALIAGIIRERIMPFVSSHWRVLKNGDPHYLFHICFDWFKKLRLFVNVLNLKIDVVLKASRAVVIRWFSLNEAPLELFKFITDYLPYL
jgi:hypothetical protein